MGRELFSFQSFTSFFHLSSLPFGSVQWHALLHSIRSNLQTKQFHKTKISPELVRPDTWVSSCFSESSGSWLSLTTHQDSLSWELLQLTTPTQAQVNLMVVLNLDMLSRSPTLTMLDLLHVDHSLLLLYSSLSSYLCTLLRKLSKLVETIKLSSLSFVWENASSSASKRLLITSILQHLHILLFQVITSLVEHGTDSFSTLSTALSSPLPTLSLRSSFS